MFSSGIEILLVFMSQISGFSENTVFHFLFVSDKFHLVQPERAYAFIFWTYVFMIPELMV